ncbi:MAG: CDP-diacylglycerol--glycerol-3-phosphate 3-phosphatidyltransferase [Treponema sp.]|jgi:CDP-diacylglycerol--glycerol-3-phosphate 3-phosphatidyltransferase|nr:CDP-diacylglycerol--glycerol-3-phosphate 3-phosphatidyltransferase [Treponema sp.]
MTAADKVTLLRIILAPFFFILFLLPELGILGPEGISLFQGRWYLVVLWVLFLVIEMTDWLDGKVARLRNEVSDFGKIFDPFADTLVRLTYFLCFIVTGILPVIPFLIIIYREFGILFIRILMMKKGVAMGARWGGKIKAVSYMITGIFCLLSVTVERLGITSLVSGFRMTANIIFIISTAIAVISFVDYLILYKKTGKT